MWGHPRACRKQLPGQCCRTLGTSSQISSSARLGGRSNAMTPPRASGGLVPAPSSPEGLPALLSQRGDVSQCPSVPICDVPRPSVPGAEQGQLSQGGHPRPPTMRVPHRTVPTSHPEGGTDTPSQEEGWAWSSCRATSWGETGADWASLEGPPPTTELESASP